MKKIFGFLAVLVTISVVAYAVPLTPGVATPLLSSTSWTPASSADNCVKGRVGYDNNYFYWCYADNNVRRTSHDNTW
jgi:hypothetical protein